MEGSENVFQTKDGILFAKLLIAVCCIFALGYGYSSGWFEGRFSFSAFSADPQTAEQAAYITTTDLNLRQEPFASSAALVVVPKGATVLVIDFNDQEWYQVTYNDWTGYMSAQYLQAVDITPDAQY